MPCRSPSGVVLATLTAGLWDSCRMRDWDEWHEGYEDPSSALARRLAVVKRFLQTALDGLGPSPAILSLCSGDGRDVIGVLQDRPERVGRAVLVELDGQIASRAARAATDAGLDEVEVRNRDAGALDSFADVVPVDVLMLCGIFGNIEHASVRNVIECASKLVRAGGWVIWTRGGSAPDRRSQIRSWFVDAGFEEIAFAGAPEPYGVGLNRLVRPARGNGDPPPKLFSFQQQAG